MSSRYIDPNREPPFDGFSRTLQGYQLDGRSFAGVDSNSDLQGPHEDNNTSCRHAFEDCLTTPSSGPLRRLFRIGSQQERSRFRLVLTTRITQSSAGGVMRSLDPWMGIWLLLPTSSVVSIY
jgi:hypothetical protein